MSDGTLKLEKPHKNPDEEAILDEIIAMEADRLKFKPRDPPPELKAFIEEAPLELLQGVLIEVLATMKDREWSIGSLLARYLLMMVGDEESEE